jgi:hypothetical protein
VTNYFGTRQQGNRFPLIVEKNLFTTARQAATKPRSTGRVMLYSVELCGSGCWLKNYNLKIVNYKFFRDILKDKYFFGSKPVRTGEVKFRI